MCEFYGKLGEPFIGQRGESGEVTSGGGALRSRVKGSREGGNSRSPRSVGHQ
jgi:hypothetical protein